MRMPFKLPSFKIGLNRSERPAPPFIEDDYGQAPIDANVLDQPRIFLIRMVVFLMIVAVLITILLPQISEAFVHNVGLNGFIAATLLFGIIHAFLQITRLFPEISWVNHFRIADPGLELPYQPRLLAPMATLLRDRQGLTVLSPLSTRTLLDSLAARLDESRDLSRYLIGLLIFLGLLGTFWGLLDTVQSVSGAINSLDVTASESASLFGELKNGLAAPLRGMGTSFSSSLFGLAASLILGFLDLQTSSAQNRFYNDLENWLSSFTNLEAGDSAGAGQVNVPHYLRLDLRDLQSSIDRMNKTLEANLNQMREEQKILRQMIQQSQRVPATTRSRLRGDE